MVIEERIDAFQKLGNYLSAIDEGTLADLALRARNENPWFTRESIETALRGVAKYLAGDALLKWASSYDLTHPTVRVVAIVMAGNIPLAGFHDFLAVLMSGHSVQIKMSSKDSVLMSHLSDQLVKIQPAFRNFIVFSDRLRNFNAVIATGSDNAARYFNFYFGKYPHIIRKNRTSCAVLTGNESETDLIGLGRDIFTYYGLGCRNVSKIYMPEGYNLQDLFQGWTAFRKVLDHHKYHNNYDYQKSILLVNRLQFFDSGFLIMQESEKLVSPISVLYFEYYREESALALKLVQHRDKIQCIVGRAKPASVAFGQAQFPELTDYADQIDTLRFLEQLN